MNNVQNCGSKCATDVVFPQIFSIRIYDMKNIQLIESANSFFLFLISQHFCFSFPVSRRKRSDSEAGHVCAVPKGAHLFPGRPGPVERWLGWRQEEGESPQVTHPAPPPRHPLPGRCQPPWSVSCRLRKPHDTRWVSVSLFFSLHQDDSYLFEVIMLFIDLPPLPLQLLRLNPAEVSGSLSWALIKSNRTLEQPKYLRALPACWLCSSVAAWTKASRPTPKQMVNLHLHRRREGTWTRLVAVGRPSCCTCSDALVIRRLMKT